MTRPSGFQTTEKGNAGLVDRRPVAGAVTAELAPERRAAMELDAQSECQAALLKYLEGSDYRTGFLSPGDCVHISKSCRCLNQ